MALHEITLPHDICDKLVDFTKTLDLQSQHEATRGDRDGTSAFISQTKGGIRESTTVKDKNMFVDHREYLILKHYENHQESGYTNYAHQDISYLVPNEIFDHFNLDRQDCKVDVKKFAPGKIHIPHKDYYINYIYNMVDRNGAISYENKPNHDVTRPVIRLWITLTEPKFGHILIVENKTYYALPQGSIVTWNGDELHTAANLGYEDRFIMTITGQVKF
jgi:hypothetical protein